MSMMTYKEPFLMKWGCLLKQVVLVVKVMNSFNHIQDYYQWISSINKVNSTLPKINSTICASLHAWSIKIKMLNWILDKLWIYESNSKFLENYLRKYYDTLKMKTIKISKRFHLQLKTNKWMILMKNKHNSTIEKSQN